MSCSTLRTLGLFCFLLALFCFIAARLACGQTATITGTVVDPNGVPYANGNGVITLVPQNQNFLIGNNPIPSPIPISQLDSRGRFQVSLYRTDLMSPSFANPQWQFSFCSQRPNDVQRPVCFTMYPIYVTGNADISTLIPGQSAPLPGPGGGGGGMTLQTNGTNNPVQNLLNLRSGPNVTLTPDPTGGVTIGSTGGGGAGGNVPSTLLKHGYSADFNWTPQIQNTPLTAGVQATITLVPCPRGMDNSGDFHNGVGQTLGAGLTFADGGYSWGHLPGMTVHIQSSVTNWEDPFVLGGTGVAGSASCTINIVPYNSYPAGWAVGPSSWGIQEALNDTCGFTPVAGTATVPGNTNPDLTTGVYYWNNNCIVYVTPNANNNMNGNPAPNYGTYIPPFPNTNYPFPGGALMPNGVVPVTGRIFMHAMNAVLSGYGATVGCAGRGPCLQVGRQLDGGYSGNTVEGIRFVAGIDYNGYNHGTFRQEYNGSLIVSTQRTAGLTTVCTSQNHGFRTGDPVTILWTDESNYWGDVPYIDVISPTCFTYQRPGATDVPFHTGPGVVALTYAAILDNAQGTHFIGMNGTNGYGNLGFFNFFFDFYDDEAAVLTNFQNGAIPLNVRNHGLWQPSYIFSGGQYNMPNKSVNHASVIETFGGSITAQNAACGTILNSNGVFLHDPICQAAGPWQWRIETTGGNYGGITADNIYSESSVGANPPASSTSYPGGTSPWPGTGIAGLITRSNSGAINYRGAFSPLGQVQSGGTGTATGNPGTYQLFYYFMVVHDTTTNLVTAPIEIFHWNSTGSDTPVIPYPRWANAADGIYYDMIRVGYDPAHLPNVTPGYIAGSPGTYVGSSYPYNGGCLGGSVSACGSVALAIPQCAGLVCTFTDNAATPTASYAVARGTWYTQQMGFAPASYATSYNTLISDMAVATPIISVGNSYNQPTVIITHCGQGNGGNGLATSGGGYEICVGGTSGAATAMLLSESITNGGGWQVGMIKGRLNLGTDQGGTSMWPHCLITLFDSNPAKTRATTSYRPLEDPGDADICLDYTGTYNYPATYNYGISQHAPGHLTRYVGFVVPNFLNTVPQETLTNTLETYTVPVKVTPGPFSSLQACSAIAGTEGARASVTDSTVNTFGAQIAGGGTYHVPAYCDGTHWVVQ